ncbi:LOW QUALITY PROTEIN: hypothetical protein Cgig2_023028 [Carnegiea gigantea]|uniref:Uncharacterized protein n=1 Tax=Carnegiea gigantea TaxID=171969 RepID=A0A9Q1K7N4_9CARY|nr:LOW QUALITY PROTEIN: hypothetical protein Cgig2_023028 [Carnegiea gigantea]
MRINIDLFGILSLQDHVFNREQKIISWKSTAKPTFKINLEAYRNKDRTVVVGAAIVRNAEFQRFIGITRRIVSPCMLEIVLLTLKEALIQVWGYHLDHLELDLEKQLSGTTGLSLILKNVVTDIRKLLDRKWHITLNLAHRVANLTASVLAIMRQGQKLFILCRLEPALELDKQTYRFANKIQEEDESDPAE